jgi:hypothetical protein
MWDPQRSATGIALPLPLYLSSFYSPGMDRKESVFHYCMFSLPGKNVLAKLFCLQSLLYCCLFTQLLLGNGSSTSQCFLIKAARLEYFTGLPTVLFQGDVPVTCMFVLADGTSSSCWRQHLMFGQHPTYFPNWLVFTLLPSRLSSHCLLRVTCLERGGPFAGASPSACFYDWRPLLDPSFFTGGCSGNLASA